MPCKQEMIACAYTTLPIAHSGYDARHMADEEVLRLAEPQH